MKIYKTIDDPWFGYIARGIKTYEGRLRRKEWSSLQVGDTIVISSSTLCPDMTVKVTDIRHYPDFVSAWEDLGSKLVPGEMATTGQEVKSIYNRFFTDEEIRGYGVVGVGLTLVDDE
jgi:ASC-1-like (ASCH) protein